MQIIRIGASTLVTGITTGSEQIEPPEGRSSEVLPPICAGVRWLGDRRPRLEWVIWHPAATAWRPSG